MWRNIQGIPRAFRGQFNGCGRTAGSVCKDEENKDHEVSQASGDRNNLIRPYIFNRSFQHHWQNVHNQDKKWSHEEDSKWQKTFKNHFWGTLNQPHSTLEVVGWGTALLLGFHLSQLVRLQGESCRRKYQLKHDAAKFGLGFPEPYGFYSACCIKDCPPERCSTDVEGGEGASEISNSERNLWEDRSQSSVFESREVLQFDSTFNDKSRPKKVSFEDDGINAAATCDDPLPSASSHWSQALSFYQSTVYNTQGLNTANKGDLNGAIKFWQKASQAGFCKSDYNLGLCYETGKGVPVDYPKAAEYYQKASLDGHSGASYNLAILYLIGKGGIDKDVDRAMGLLHQAADQGLVEAQRELGVIYTERNQMEQAVDLFAKAAKQLDAGGQYYLGICYENGFGVPVNTCKAAQLYAIASRAGHPEAKYNLAVFYEKGLGGLPKDPKEALSLYKSLAQSGNKDAQQQVKRLESLIRDEESEEDTRELTFSGFGRNVRVGVSASSPSLIQYLEKHLAEFGLGEWDSKHERPVYKYNMQASIKAPAGTNVNSKYNTPMVEFILGSDDLNDNDKSHDNMVWGGYGDTGVGMNTGLQPPGGGTGLLPLGGGMSRSTSAFELKLP